MQEFYQIKQPIFSNTKSFNNNYIENTNTTKKEFNMLRLTNNKTNNIYNKTNFKIPEIIIHDNNYNIPKEKFYKKISKNSFSPLMKNKTLKDLNNKSKEKNLFSSKNFTKRENLFFDDIQYTPKKLLISEILNSNNNDKKNKIENNTENFISNRTIKTETNFQEEKYLTEKKKKFLIFQK